MARLFMQVFRVIIFFSLLYSVIHFFLSKKSFTFAHKDVHKLAEKYSGQHPTQCLTKLVGDMRRKYNGHILPDSELDWLTFSAGGLKGKLLFLHVSLTEYIAVFGSPMHTSGHTGFQWLNQSCSLLLGNVQRWKDGPQLSREEHAPGDYIRTPMFQSTVADLSEESWLVCYGRGFLPASIPYAITENLLVNFDVWSVLRFQYVTIRGALRETSLWAQELIDYYLKKH